MSRCRCSSGRHSRRIIIIDDIDAHLPRCERRVDATSFEDDSLSTLANGVVHNINCSYSLQLAFRDSDGGGGKCKVGAVYCGAAGGERNCRAAGRSGIIERGGYGETASLGASRARAERQFAGHGRSGWRSFLRDCR